jgi:hypothetical protein
MRRHDYDVQRYDNVANMHSGRILSPDTCTDSYARLKATSINFACDGQDEMSTAFDEAVGQLENIHRSPVKMARRSHQQIHLTSIHIRIGHSRGLPSRTPDVWK